MFDSDVVADYERLTRQPLARQDLAGNTIRQWHRCEPHTNQDLRNDHAIDVGRARRYSRSHKRDDTSRHEDELASLESIRRGSYHGTQHGLHEGERLGDPCLSDDIVQIFPDIGEL